MFQATFLILLSIIISCTPIAKDKARLETAVRSDIKGLDPAFASGNYSLNAISQIYEGLYHFNNEARPLEVEPLLAESLPKISQDGRTYAMTLKKGVFFSSDEVFPGGNRELVASDFVYSMKRLLDPRNPTPGAPVFREIIDGADVWRASVQSGEQSFEAPLSGLKATGKYSLEIRLTRPLSHFVQLLTLPFAMVVAPEAVKHYGKDLNSNPVGTGPYLLKTWKKGAFVDLVANPKFRSTSTQPAFKNVRINIIQSDQNILTNFLTGNIDFVSAPEGFENKLGEITALGAEIIQAPRFDVTYLGFNMEHPVLGKYPELRKAIAIAVDRKTLVKTFYKERAQVLSGPVPNGLFGHKNANIVAIDGELKEAQDLLAGIGFPKGKGLPTITFSVSNIARSRQLGEYLKDRLSKIGIDMKVSISDWPQFEKKVKGKNADMFLMSWVADYPDPEAFMQLFYGGNVSPGSNSSNFRNSEYDNLYRQLQSDSAPSKRAETIGKMAAILKSELPVIFMAQRKSHLLVQKGVSYPHFHPSIFDSYKHLSRRKGR